MSNLTSRRWVLARYIRELPQEEDFRLETVTLAPPGEGELRVKTLYASVDPGALSRLGGVASYAPPLGLGEAMTGAAVGEVLDSRHEGFSPGDRVVGAWGWSEHAVVAARSVRKVEASGPWQVSAELGVFGIPGLTAWVGIRELGKPLTGETVLVSSAAGAVGSIAGQLAKRSGHRVVGIAGGPVKCRWLVDELGFDAAIDYRAEPDLTAAIRRECPGGVGVFLDNVGGAVLDAALPCMAMRGRIVVSGLVADYGVPPERRAGLKNTPFFITHRLRMEGFVVYDYAERFGEARTELRRSVADGALRHREHVEEGLEAAPRLFAGLFHGTNFGRALVRVGRETA
ncbi:MAG: NADP-dependent oxidoreductase [Cystobacter sp.]